MSVMAELPSSPPSGEVESLAWYKSQYEQLEQELSEFRESSKELEGELERDLDAADKRERALQEKAESLSFEVEEWKTKYKQSKTEANAAQSTLEKEITTLRDANRTLQLKLRDIEVANDDFERQARNTTSSLEDLESKYNVAIERAVMMEEEIKLGEQEREQLRVEAQRLREELSDLKIEAEILQDKLKKQESRHLSAISTDLSIPESPGFEHSPNSTASSPLITTPPDIQSLPTAKTVQDPPSPPMSDVSAKLLKVKEVKTPAPSTRKKSRLPSADNSITPKPRNFNSSISSASGRTPGTRAATTSSALRTPVSRTTTSKPTRTAATANNRKLPTSTSLTHVRSLTAQMQRLEARVQSVRSKLPAPVVTPPRASPRSSINVPSSVTIRSRKRTMGSAASNGPGDATLTHDLRRSVTASTSKHVPRLSTSNVSRLSFGPAPNRNPGGHDGVESRPSSRASVSSYARPGSRSESHSMIPPPRPVSRTSMTGTRTPLGSQFSRPRSSLGGSLHGRRESQSGNSSFYGTAEVDEEEPPPLPDRCQTPIRRGTYSRLEAEAGASGIPAPTSSIPLPSSARRLSGAGSIAGSRRTSSVAGHRMADLGETY